MTLGNCEQPGANPEAWFPTDSMSELSQQELATSLCGGCPARDACLAIALDREGEAGTSSRFGLWGGLTPRERYNLNRRQKRANTAGVAS